jgi:polyisoprenoid-binding protein YceI
MAEWTFEPGHTEAAFRARHMMVTWVRGLFKDIHGKLRFDLADPLAASFEGVIDARKIWTGQPERDAHLRSADFFDVERYPTISFRGRTAERTGDTQGKAVVELTIRDITRDVTLDVSYLGQWETPFWVGDENRGVLHRAGFEGRTRIDRNQFGVSWQDRLPGAGVVVGNEVDVVLDVEAILDEDLERTGAIEYYREPT